MIGALGRKKAPFATPYQGTPGIGDGQPGMPGSVPDLGDFTPTRAPTTQGASVGQPARMAFRGISARRGPLNLDMSDIYAAADREDTPMQIGAPISPASDPHLDTSNIPGVPAPKPKFFGEGGTGRVILGVLSDALAGAAGQPGQYAEGLRQQRELKIKQAEYQRQLSDRWNMWKAQQDYERANPKAAAPHYFQDNAGNEWQVGADGKPQMLHTDDTPRMNFIPDGLGGGQWVAVPTGAPSGGTTSNPAVGTVMADPRKGGGAGNGTGGFR